MSENRKHIRFVTCALVFFMALQLQAQSTRERINFDADWFFAFGHPYDKSKDFGTGTSYFTYLAKARYGADGAAAQAFDHRAWRPVNLPHDWAVEMPFDKKGSHSHGYKAVGPGFPEVSVGWYRKEFVVDSLDLGKQFFLDFDGVSRDSRVWVNGHYLGNEPSGYQSFSYNISDILNYGGKNTVAVRADVSMEEGWYYEGAGIYRHVWLRKTHNLHIPKDGIFVYTKINDQQATVFVEAEIVNKDYTTQHFEVSHSIVDGKGIEVYTSNGNNATLNAMEKTLLKAEIPVENPHLWSLENPHLYTLHTEVSVEGKVVDTFHTKFGVRSIRFDADKGFFLNGKHVKLKGTNNHQDHAGVGCALPDSLIRWRLQQLKNFGGNAIRSSHNPPTPELLQLCDEMGLLVIDENRLMGTTENALTELERLIRRDRNHPSVIVWSIGNEEWGIEWNEIGARMTRTMQNFAKQIDPTRPVNVAVSGGWGEGSSTEIEVMGFNYLVHGNTDEYHKKFPNTPCIGTEEGSTYTVRGVYEVDEEKHYKTAYDVLPLPDWYTIQQCWQHYDARDYLAGMFIWTGFDYRGEPTPYKWPSVTSYFGMMDMCGFPKDNVYYLKSWWQQEETVLHVLPHWNWKGREGDTLDVWVYSNAEEVELRLNGTSLGHKKMEKNGHLSWKVAYVPGTLEAVGFVSGKEVKRTAQTTTGEAKSIQIAAHKTHLHAANDVAMLTVDVQDKDGNHIPTADHLIHFEVEGPGKIIGVGNGNPTSLEKEVFVDSYQQLELPDAKVWDFNSAEMQQTLSTFPKSEQKTLAELKEVKGMTTTFHLEDAPGANQKFTWLYTHVGKAQRIYLNGQLLSTETRNENEAFFELPNNWLKKGENDILIITEPFPPKNQWDTPNKKPGTLQVIQSAETPHRKLFNGLAQVIVQPTGKGTITLKAVAPGLKSATLELNAQ